MSRLHQGFFLRWILAVSFLVCVPKSFAASLREKFQSVVSSFYSKVSGQKATTRSCQDIFLIPKLKESNQNVTMINSSSALESSLPTISDDLNLATAIYLKLYYAHQSQLISPQVVLQAFHQLIQQAMKDEFTQEQIKKYKNDITHENYANFIFRGQKSQSFVFFDDVFFSEFDFQDVMTSEFKFPFSSLFSVNKKSTTYIYNNAETIKSELPNEVFYVRIEKIFPDLHNFLLSLYGIDGHVLV